MKANHPLDRNLGQAAAVCALGASGLALAHLVFWWFGDWLQHTFGSDFLPMPPSAALLMVLLGVATLLRTRPSPSRASRFVETSGAILVLGGAASIGCGQWFRPDLSLDHWLSLVFLSDGSTSISRMAPLSAVFFAMSAAAVLCGRWGAARWEGVRTLGIALSMTVLLGGGIILLGFMGKVPFLYGALAVPMALLTALALVLVSSALLLGAGSGAWPLRMFLRGENTGAGDLPAKVAWPLLLVFAGLTLGITTAGILYLKHEEGQTRSAAHQELETIAGMKIQQIVSWRRERLADADFIRATPDTLRRALALLTTPEVAATKAPLIEQLRPVLFGGTYVRAVLLDPELKIQLVVPEGAPSELSEEARRVAEGALRTRQITVADLHREVKGGHVNMDFAVPLTPPHEGGREGVAGAGAAPGLTNETAGVLLLQIDADDFLYPLIQSWPTKSSTAETLLVRREGQEVVYLNALRHRKGSGLTLRRRVDEAQLPAAMGLRGEQGIQSGVDYRGVRVVAATRSVPDTGWVLVAKVDEDELYAPLRRDTLTAAGVVSALLLAAILSVTVLWRRRNEQFLQTQLAVERARLAMAERFEHLMKSAGDAILLGDEQDHILEANDQAVTLYGWTLAELKGMRAPELRAETTRAGFQANAEDLAVAGATCYATIHQRKDGSSFPVEVSTRIVEVGGERYKLGIIRDITQRKAHEAEIERLNRLYATLSQVNQTIVRCPSREELFADICRVAVEFGRFQAAWIGWLEADGKTLTTVANRMLGTEPDQAMPGWEGSCGVITEAVSTAQPCLCKNAQTDERAACCQQVLARLGAQACAAFPLRMRGAVCGAFSICSIETSFFNADEARLLEEVAADISFALDKLDKEEQSRVAEAALRASEKRFRSLVVATSQIIWSLDPQGKVVGSQPSFQAFTGQSDEEIRGDGWMAALHPEDVPATLKAWQGAVAAKAGYEFACRLRRGDGVYRNFVARSAPVLAEDGRILEWIGTCSDVTESQRAQQELRRQTDELRLRNEELTRFNRATVGRELRMVELKQQVNELCRRLGEAPCYALAFGAPSPVSTGEHTNEPAHK